MINSANPTDKPERRFQKLALLTILVVYLVILAGGIVRSTGSGMGCPDWPKCFGRWIPPTEISQLPTNYQEIYGAKLKGEIEFNAVKTWIEYANRLIGVLSGFFVFGTLVASLVYIKKDKAVVWSSFAAFILIGLNGWLGSRVVATELAQYMITLHLLLAIAVVFALIFALMRSVNNQRITTQTGISTLQRLLIGLMFLTVIQLVLGTQVRSALDEVIKRVGYADRDNWISNLSGSFYVHRSFSILLFAFHLLVVSRLRKIRGHHWLLPLTNGLLIMVVAEIIVGVTMAYLAVPAVTQPIHLLLAILLIGAQFAIWILINPKLLQAQSVSKTSGLVEI